MENNTLPSWLQSSMDPTAVSNTVRGAGAAISGVVLLALAIAGHPIAQEGYAGVVDQTAILAGQVSAGLGAAWMLFGLLMKGIVFASKLFSKNA